MAHRTLQARLVLAVVIPIILVTASLYPIFRSHLAAKQDGAQASAEAMLEAGHESLQRGMGESVSLVLATAETPLLQHHLTPPEAAASHGDLASAGLADERLEAQFDTLLRHYARYTKVVLIDTQGRERLRVTRHTSPARPPLAVDHAEADYFREAMKLFPRDLYVSPPGRGRHSGHTGKEVVPVIDIATPVFGADGQRLGVLLFSLDWHYLTAGLRHSLSIDTNAQPVMIDAQGNWLLSMTTEPPFDIDYGDPIPTAFRESLATAERGQAEFDDHRIQFRTIDIRNLEHRGLAGMTHSLSDYHPWWLGVAMPKPDLATLLADDIAPLMILTLLYGLSVAFGIFWVLSSHRQLRLKWEAQQRAREVRDLYENAPCGYHSLDSSGRVVKMNHTELEWLGYRAEEVIGKRHYRDFVSPATRAAFDAGFRNVLGPSREGMAECELITRSGQALPVVIQGTAYTNRLGFVHSRAMVFDLTERKRLEETLARQAMTDPLTGLGNRRYLEDQAAKEIARAQRSGEALSLIAVDLDRFKRINDEYGHDVGDLVLQTFAETAKSRLREGDVLCRMGGEEFAILLPSTAKAQAMRVAERLRQAIETTPVPVGQDVSEDGLLHYTASLGVTLVMAQETNLKSAIKRADRGLYAAKEKGRNQAWWQAV
ncbi:diguanylate cyclase [Billgrantia gudaonensis]|uniref:diguanylate cyclase n=1 Tax=Billgrantia gudaonensis TaxID=376427 RepID=A0A1G8YAN5_9GAMM|nr:diguanylate cyclase [Halomonas gudaonensis]SDJ99908.1 PAS domain S-box-containing protein/diguanylate cyclase (GGDEF) domain-containing protein [Halomonas gudaonensis]